MALVSVVMPSYNCFEYIGESIESVINQTYQNWELLIVDDCSTDHTREVIAGYMRKESRIKLLTLESNSGAAVARNTAIKAAKGRYIAFLDSDDIWLKDKLSIQIDFMLENEVEFSCTLYSRYLVDGDSILPAQPIPEYMTYEDLLKQNKIGCLTAVYDAGRLGKIYMPLLRKRQDYGLWLAVLKKTLSVYCLQKDLALYRIRTGSISSNKIYLIKYNWKLFRDVEGLSFMKSLICLSNNIIHRIIK